MRQKALEKLRDAKQENYWKEIISIIHNVIYKTIKATPIGHLKTQRQEESGSIIGGYKCCLKILVSTHILEKAHLLCLSDSEMQYSTTTHCKQLPTHYKQFWVCQQIRCCLTSVYKTFSRRAIGQRDNDYIILKDIKDRLVKKTRTLSHTTMIWKHTPFQFISVFLLFYSPSHVVLAIMFIYSLLP